MRATYVTDQVEVGRAEFYKDAIQLEYEVLIE